jgi:hypothetical protein
MNKLLVCLMFLLICFPGYSRPDSPSIHFENTAFNFGTVREEDGVLQHEFLFFNNGDGPLVVANVSASGGVSVTRWTRSPVMPGDTGTISLEYDPVNKPGRFNRSITITSTGTPSRVVLRLLGNVIRRERTPEEMYPGEIGPLRLKSSHISFGHVAPGSVITDSVQVINLSGEILDISFSHIPGHVSVEAVPRKLEPGREGLFIASYDAGLIDDWGVITHSFRVLINGSSPGRNIIYISASILDDFSSLSDAEKEKAPAISFENRVFDFGRISHGESREHHFIFTNTGQSELIIRAVRSGCGCTATEPQKSLLRPGESSSIYAVFNSRGFRGRQNKGITVISNDPANQSVLLRVTGEVLSE